jgi:hypothetical protein
MRLTARRRALLNVAAAATGAAGNTVLSHFQTGAVVGLLAAGTALIAPALAVRGDVDVLKTDVAQLKTDVKELKLMVNKVVQKLGMDKE